jgi:hypothetical protein
VKPKCHGWHLRDEQNSKPQGNDMTSIVININEYLSTSAAAEALSDSVDHAAEFPEGVDGSVEWPGQIGGIGGAAMLDLTPPDIAAIVVRGCFGLYHLVREHDGRRTSVPPYLLQFARDYEVPLIPAAEQLYFAFFCEHGEQPDEVPRELFELGCVECEEADRCSVYAQQLHELVEAFAKSGAALHPLLPVVFAGGEPRLLVQIMLVEYHRWAKIPGEPN